MSKLVNLCIFFGIELNVSDPNETMKTIFKKVKARLIKLIDFDEGAEPIARKLDLS